MRRLVDTFGKTMSGKPVFRHPDKFQRLAFRDWLRENMPGGNAGFVVEDLDLVIRWYGDDFDKDSTGAFMLVELKYGGSFVGHAQMRTFGLIDKLMRTADPKAERYLGFFVVQYSDENWDEAEFRINRTPVTRKQFVNFWKLSHRIPSLF